MTSLPKVENTLENRAVPGIAIIFIIIERKLFHLKMVKANRAVGLGVLGVGTLYYGNVSGL